MRNIIILLMLFVALGSSAQNNEDLALKTYKEGIAALGRGEDNVALTKFNKAISLSRTASPYCLMYIAIIRRNKEQYDRAMKAINESINRAPSDDNELKALVYSIRSSIYLQQKDTTNAISDLGFSIAASPHYDTYEERGELNYDRGYYYSAESDFKAAISQDGKKSSPYYYLGEISIINKKYSEGVNYFTSAIQINPKHFYAYGDRAFCYLQQGIVNKAIDDIISGLSQQIELYKPDNSNLLFTLGSPSNWDVMQQLEGDGVTLMKNKLLAKSRAYPKESIWPQSLSILCESNGALFQSIEYFIDYFNKATNGDDYMNIMNIVNDYRSCGLYNKAIEWVDKGMKDTKIEPMYKPWLLSTKADILADSKRYDEAITLINNYITKGEDEKCMGTLFRGEYKRLKGDDTGALADYNEAIRLDSTYAYAHFVRAEYYASRGNIDLAKKDYQKVVDLEAEQEEMYQTPYAYLALGERDKAVDVLNKLLSDDHSNFGYEDAAWFAVKDNNPSEAFRYLKLCEKFDKPLMDDERFNALHDYTEYQEIVKDYTEKTFHRI